MRAACTALHGRKSAVSEASTYEDWTSSSDWPVASAESLAGVEAELPRLVDALCAALERGGSPHGVR